MRLKKNTRYEVTTPFIVPNSDPQITIPIGSVVTFDWRRGGMAPICWVFVEYWSDLFMRIPSYGKCGEELHTDMYELVGGVNDDEILNFVSELTII